MTGASPTRSTTAARSELGKRYGITGPALALWERAQGRAAPFINSNDYGTSPMAHETLKQRTDAKIRFARLHLRELVEDTTPGQGHDFQRSHIDAFFAQLFGAYAALFQELNEDLGCGLPAEGVTLGGMRNATKAKGPVSPKLTELYALEQDGTSWLSQAKAMRDHVTHIGAIPMTFYMGGPNDGTASLHHPTTKTVLPGNYRDQLEQWTNEMAALIEKMRA